MVEHSPGNPRDDGPAATRPVGEDATPVMAAPESVPDDSTHVFKLDERIAGRYRVLRYIGKGGMGEVYEVEDERLHERFALKTLTPELQVNSEYVLRFRREVRTALKVTHPNVCRIHPISDDATFFTMELLSGETLAELLRRGLLPLEVRMQLMRGVLAGLAAIHDQGILHRDMKPGNVMVVPVDRGYAAKITDFGLARLWVSTDTPITKHGEAQGTLLYMAPELLKGATATPASDIWATGMLMYELMTGVHPLRHLRTLSALQDALFAGSITPPRTHAPDLNEDVERTIIRCLSLDPKERYSNPHDIVRSFDSQPAHTASSLTDLRKPADNLTAEAIPAEFKCVLDDADGDVAAARYTEARDKIENVLKAAPAGSITHIAARMDLIEIQLLQGSEVERARETILGCLQELPPHDRKRRRTALLLLGDAEAFLGNVSTARSVFAEVLDLARELKDRFSEASALVGLARVEELRGDLETAERHLDDAIGLFRAEHRDATSDSREKKVSAINAAAALSTRARLLTHTARLPEALVSVEAALPLLREAGSDDNIEERFFSRLRSF